MSRAQNFADALQRLERDHDLDSFLDQFSSDVELLRPESGGRETGLEGARRYWQAYLDQFAGISSEFSRVVDADRYAELEWTSEGQLRTERDIAYAGVSLLEHNDEGKVRRFATYYDTAPFAGLQAV